MKNTTQKQKKRYGDNRHLNILSSSWIMYAHYIKLVNKILKNNSIYDFCKHIS